MMIGNKPYSNVNQLTAEVVFQNDVPREVLVAMEEHARDVGVQALGTWALLNFVGISRKRARELYESLGTWVLGRFLGRFLGEFGRIFVISHEFGVIWEIF